MTTIIVQAMAYHYSLRYGVQHLFIIINGMDEPSFDFTLSSRFEMKKPDPIERVRAEIRLLEEENLALEAEIQNVRDNPWEYVREAQKALVEKINHLRHENLGLEHIIERNKYPGFAEMTKKKSSMLETPGKGRTSRDTLWENDSKDPFDQIDLQSEKGEASTCQNFPLDNSYHNPILSLEPLRDSELRSRTMLTAEILHVIDNTSRLEEELEAVRGDETNRQVLQGASKTLKDNSERLRKIKQYKAKLLDLLHKMKQKEASIHEIAQAYRRMHEQTAEQLSQATQILSDLESAHVDDSIDEAYAEVVQLEERLRYINEQLEKLDEGQWIRDVTHQLNGALRRIGVVLPECPDEQSMRDRIDEACEILIECVAHQKTSDRDRLHLLKFYHEEEKENNKRILKNLQKKEHGLSKKLIDLQMNQ